MTPMLRAGSFGTASLEDDVKCYRDVIARSNHEFDFDVILERSEGSRAFCRNMYRWVNLGRCAPDPFARWREHGKLRVQKGNLQRLIQPVLADIFGHRRIQKLRQ